MHAGWRASVAIRPEQIRAADELVRRRYAWRGYRAPVSDACVKQEDPYKVMLLAENGGRLVGTVTVRPDSKHGLYAEGAYRQEIDHLRRNGHRLGELVKFALEEGADWKNAVNVLMQTTYLVTRVIHRLTDVVIEVNPRHALFYRRALGFVSEAAERFCERAGAPCVLLRLDLALAGRRLQLAA
jgi:hypothetical protein